MNSNLKSKTFEGVLQLSQVQLYIISILLIIGYAMALYGINLLFTGNRQPFSAQMEYGTDWNIIAKSMFAIFIGPFIETFLHQYLPIELLLKIKRIKNKPYIAVFASALLFGLGHYYSFYYIVYAFGMGVIFGFFYLILKIRGQEPFLHTYFLHAIINFLVFCNTILPQLV